MERHLNPYIEIPPLVWKAVLAIRILHFPLAFEVSLEATGIYVRGYFCKLARPSIRYRDNGLDGPRMYFCLIHQNQLPAMPFTCSTVLQFPFVVNDLVAVCFMASAAEFNQNVIARISRAADVICRYRLPCKKRLIHLPDCVVNVVTRSCHEQAELRGESMSELGFVLFRYRRNSELRHAGCELVGGQVLVNECSKAIQLIGFGNDSFISSMSGLSLA